MDMPSSSSAPRRGTLKQRLFAYMLTRESGTLDDISTQHKRALFRDLHGQVVEIGPGGGANLRYYPADIDWLGIEPNPAMHPYLQRAIRELGHSPEHFQIHPGDPSGVRLPVADESVDALVSTLVLCSVPHPEASLREILRVLKPGGKFVFIEHVAAPRDSRLRKLQNLLQPVWSFVGEGCHPNRETWETIAQAGFARVEIEHYRFPGAGPVGPHIAGAAYKA